MRDYWLEKEIAVEFISHLTIQFQGNESLAFPVKLLLIKLIKVFPFIFIKLHQM